MFKYRSNLGKRIAATLIDYGLYFLLFVTYVKWFGHSDNIDGKIVDGLQALPIFIFWFFYFVCVEALLNATLGHFLLHLRVVSIDRKSIDFSQALRRHLLDPIDIVMYGIPAIIAIKNTSKRQRLGDMWAGTVVVDTKDPEQYPQTT